MPRDTTPASSPTPTRPQDRPPRPMQKLKAERVELLLAALPGWQATPDRTTLSREWQVRSAAQALDLAAFACRLASRRFGEPWVLVRRNKVQVRVSTPAVGGLTQADLAFARRLEDWVDRLEKGGTSPGDAAG
jgi:pterin-4a-carbinolamine dehydratase